MSAPVMQLRVVQKIKTEHKRPWWLLGSPVEIVTYLDTDLQYRLADDDTWHNVPLEIIEEADAAA